MGKEDWKPTSVRNRSKCKGMDRVDYGGLGCGMCGE